MKAIFVKMSAMRKLFTTLILIMLMGLCFCGCKKSGTRFIIARELKSDEVFRIEDMVCRVPEMMVYLVNYENRYSESLGREIFSVPLEDKTVGDAYKEAVLSRISQIKAMNLLAEKEKVSLTDEELAMAGSAAADYIATLNPDELALMGADTDLLRQMYAEYALADKVYRHITGAVNPEISDDEARTITVKAILIKNTGRDSYEKALAARNRIMLGEDFDIVAADDNEDTRTVYSFGRGVMPDTFEDAAFDLATDEVSNVIETEYGYHIIKCVSTYDLSETERTKENIIIKKKQEAFNEVYSEFAKGLAIELNKETFDGISFDRAENIKTDSFFAIFDSYFVDAEG